MAAYNITADPEYGDYLSLPSDSLRKQRIDRLAEQIYTSMYEGGKTPPRGQQRSSSDTNAGRGDEARKVALKQAIAIEAQEQNSPLEILTANPPPEITTQGNEPASGLTSSAAFAGRNGPAPGLTSSAAFAGRQGRDERPLDLSQAPVYDSDSSTAEGLSEEKKKAVAKVFEKHPEYRRELMTALKASGQGFDVDEYLPIDAGIELKEMGRGALETLTLGIADTGERDPRAGDVDIFGMNLSPSNMAGNVVGALPAAIGFGAGGAALGARAGLGLTGQTVSRIVAGEAAPGFIEGLVKSDGDIDEALKMAGVWTATGLMLEGTGRLVIKSIRRMKENKRLTKEMKLAVDEYDRVAKGQGVPLLGAAPDPAGMGRWGVEGRAMGVSPHANDMDQGYREAFDQLSTSVDKIDDLAKNRFLSVALRKESLEDAAVGLSDEVDEVFAGLTKLTPERQVRLKEDMSSVWRALLIAVDEGKIDHNTAEILFRQVGTGKVNADTVIDAVSVAPNIRAGTGKGFVDDIEESWEEFEAKARKQERKTEPRRRRGRGTGPYIARKRRAARGRGGGVDLPESAATGIDARPATQDQVSRIHEIKSKLLKEGDDFDLPGPDELKGYNMREARKVEVKAKTRLSFIRALNRNRALHNLQQEAADPSGMKRYWVDNPPEYMNPSERAIHKEAVRKQKLGRLIYDEAELNREPGMLYHLGVVPHVSRWGLGSNPVSKAILDKSMHMLEDIGRQKAALWKRYTAAIAPLEASRMQKITAAVGRQDAREALETEARLKGQLVQALDGRGTNEILEANAELVPIYNELRTIFDELADGLDLPRSERISDYFPHIFGDDTALWRAMRMTNDLGEQSRFVTKYLPTEIADEIPQGRFFGSLIERRGTDAAFSEDLDAVMYAYMHGAVETPRYTTFLRDANEALEMLPAENVATRKAFADWTNYVVGRPTNWKKAQAQWWQENSTFNRWVDNAVEWLGDAETKGLLARSRKGQLSKQEEKLAVDFFDKLLVDANKFTVEGRLKGRTDMKQYRAHLALIVDDMRAALGNPAARPIVMEKLYQLMVINKLGFSVSHMVTNLTQTLTNTLPKVGLRYMSKGMKRYTGNREHEFSNGRNVEEVIEESGVLADIPEYREFFGQRKTGFIAKAADVALQPAKISEEFNRGVALLARYEQAIDEGLDHAAALVDARELVRNTQFVFNKAATMPLFRNPGARFLLMFQSYALHQMNFSAELLHDAITKGETGPLFKHLLAYITLGAGAAAMSETAPNLQEQTSHPLAGLVSSENPIDAMGGPPADMLLEMLQGNVTQALSELTTPTIERRIERADESGEIMQLLGFKSQ